jgi:serine/threonine-protein kinase RsbW
VDKIAFKSEIQNISLVEKLVDDICTRYQIHSDIYGKLNLAMVEGVNNAIVHGNKMVAEKEVAIEWQINDEALEFYITDCGPGFDYTNLPDPTTPENREKTHGRGIFLMNTLADELEFSDPGNRVKMVFYLK